jgi:hypothetical protein
VAGGCEQGEAGGSARDSSRFPIPQKLGKIRQAHKDNCQPDDIEWIEIVEINFGHKHGESQSNNRPDYENVKLIHSQENPFGLNLIKKYV